jgi:hypothetical protein
MWPTLPDEPTSKGHGRELKLFDHDDALPAAALSGLHSRYRTDSYSRFEARKRMAFARVWWTWSGSNRRPSRHAGTRGFSVPLHAHGIWWTWSGSNRRPLPCHGSALPAAPQAHMRRQPFYFLAGTINPSNARSITNLDLRHGSRLRAKAPPGACTSGRTRDDRDVRACSARRQRRRQ